MKSPLFALALAALAAPASADSFVPAMEKFLQSSVKSWSADPVLLDALRDQNATSVSYSQSEIDALDKAWRAEVGTGSSPTIDPVIGNAAADFLRARVSASAGQITEIILMDATGLNAAVSHVTSDMWQGDEAKYTETYPMGPTGVHYSEIEKDESTGRYQAQISFSITDPATGDVIGAMTVGVDAESLL
ncbi:MAG: hypothetical protein AAF686_04670 [Pseudomonadota bacterium]